MGTAVITSCNGAPVLELGQQVLDVMAHFVQPLAVRHSPVVIPSGWDARDALIRQHGADFVAVITP